MFNRGDVRDLTVPVQDLSEKLGTTSVTKSWQFPKMHSLAHLFTDRIPSKGSCRHSDSKIGEGEHRYLKIAYENSNKKDEAKQVHCTCSGPFRLIICFHLADPYCGGTARHATNLMADAMLHGRCQYVGQEQHW